MKNWIRMTIAVVALALTACSSSDDGGSSTVTNLVTTTYSEVLAQAEQASGDSGAAFSAVAIAPQSFVPFAAPDFGNAWDVTGVLNDPITNSGLITVKEYMGTQFDPDALNNNNSSVNVFGRLGTALKIFCVIGVGLGMMGVSVDADGYPENGTHTITFSAAIKAQMSLQCGMDTSDIATGDSISMTVASSSGSFAKSMTFETQVYLVKSTDSEVNIATGETHDNGTGVSRSVVFWNKTTGVMRVEYVSDPGTGFTPGQSGLYAYRMYYDETQDEAQIFTYEGPDNSASDAVRYILAGKPTNGDALSLSFKSAAVEAEAKVEGCASATNGDLLDDGARCVASSTRLNGAAIDAGATTTMISDFYTNRGDSSWATVSSSTSLGWTNMTDMVTTAIVP